VPIATKPATCLWDKTSICLVFSTKKHDQDGVRPRSTRKPELSKNRIPASPGQDESGPIPLHNRVYEIKNAVGRMNVAGPELHPQPVSVAGEREEQVKALLPERELSRDLTIARRFGARNRRPIDCDA
jgi:hypothetical protein